MIVESGQTRGRNRNARELRGCKARGSHRVTDEAGKSMEDALELSQTSRSKTNAEDGRSVCGESGGSFDIWSLWCVLDYCSFSYSWTLFPSIGVAYKEPSCLSLQRCLDSKTPTPQSPCVTAVLPSVLCVANVYETN